MDLLIAMFTLFATQVCLTYLQAAREQTNARAPYSTGYPGAVLRKPYAHYG